MTSKKLASVSGTSWGEGILKTYFNFFYFFRISILLEFGTHFLLQFHSMILTDNWFFIYSMSYIQSVRDKYMFLHHELFKNYTYTLLKSLNGIMIARLSRAKFHAQTQNNPTLPRTGIIWEFRKFLKGRAMDEVTELSYKKPLCVSKLGRGN